MGFLDNLKDRFRGNDNYDDYDEGYDDGYYDEGFDDYSEEYGEYGPDYNEDDFPADDAPVVAHQHLGHR